MHLLLPPVDAACDRPSGRQRRHVGEADTNATIITSIMIIICIFTDIKIH